MVPVGQGRDVGERGEGVQNEKSVVADVLGGAQVSEQQWNEMLEKEQSCISSDPFPPHVKPRERHCEPQALDIGTNL